MRQYGKVDTCFWTDSKIRNLSDRGRLLFLYLLTCPHSSPIGCYRLPIAYISSDLKWVTATVTQTVTLTVTEGLIEYDFKHEIVLIKNYFKHNKIDNPNVAKSCMQFIDVIEKKTPIYQSLVESLQPFAERFPNGYINGLCNGMPNIEMEMEMEMDIKDGLKNEPKIPDWINAETWDAFIEVRKAKKTPNTKRALTMLISELTKLRGAGDDPNKIIERSIINGWSGVFKLPAENKQFENKQEKVKKGVITLDRDGDDANRVN